MAVNKEMKFVQRTHEHRDECSICGRNDLGEKAAAAIFSPHDPAFLAAVYCFECIVQLAFAAKVVEVS